MNEQLFPNIKHPRHQPGEQKTPLVFKIPFFDFESADHATDELLAGEACFARIPNTSNKGFTHHVALLAKDDDGRVYSVNMIQHHGVLKDTEENRVFLKEKPQNGSELSNSAASEEKIVLEPLEGGEAEG